jgi:hypothetical protein
MSNLVMFCFSVAINILNMNNIIIQLFIIHWPHHCEMVKSSNGHSQAQQLQWHSHNLNYIILKVLGVREVLEVNS